MKATLPSPHYNSILSQAPSDFPGLQDMRNYREGCRKVNPHPIDSKVLCKVVASTASWMLGETSLSLPCGPGAHSRVHLGGQGQTLEWLSIADSWIHDEAEQLPKRVQRPGDVMHSAGGWGNDSVFNGDGTFG